MSARLVIVDSGKGGTGKSFTTVLLGDYFRVRGQAVTIVECDHVNPDVLRRLKPVLPVEHIDVAEQGGWLEILRVVQRVEGVVLVNLPSNVAHFNVRERGTALLAVRDGLGKGSVGATLLWTLDTSPDVITLLQNELVRHRGLYTHIGLLPNLRNGKMSRFSDWENSPLRKLLLDNGAGECWLPELFGPLAKTLMYGYDTSLAQLRGEEPLDDIGMRWAYDDYFRQTDALWNTLLPNLGITTHVAAA